MSRDLRHIILTVATAMVVQPATAGPSSSSFSIHSHTVSRGAASPHLSSPSFSVSHTLAQPSPAGGSRSSTNFILFPGFQAALSTGSSAPPITDTDSDGMDDDWETGHFGDLSHSASEDFDRDGLSNLLEYLLGQDPTSRGAPTWWATRSVLSGAATTNDYAALNQGQLKSIAQLAAEEMDATLSGGAGAGIDSLVSSFSTSNNYQAVNLGQLKWVAKPFYDRLMSKGQSDTYPWTDATQTNNYSAANIGMTKHLFSFPVMN